MIKIFFYILSSIGAKDTQPSVVTPDDFDAIYVPPDYSGPIIAMPIDETIF
jgi:hypothetical protein